MDNYRRPMYTRNKMGSYPGQPCGWGYTPIMESTKDKCDRDDDKCIDRLPLAMAYVPFQKWRNVYDAAAGLQTGTIFQELDLHFYGYEDRNNCNCGMRGDKYDR